MASTMEETRRPRRRGSQRWETIEWLSMILTILALLVIGHNASAFSPRSRHVRRYHPGKLFTATSGEDKQQQERQQQQTYYETLGALPTADKSELKRQYRKLARLSHPDALIGKESADHNINKSVPDFHEITTAYKVLSDPIERKRYDRSLRADQFVEETAELAESVGEVLVSGFVVPFLSNTAKVAKNAGVVVQENIRRAREEERQRKLEQERQRELERQRRAAEAKKREKERAREAERVRLEMERAEKERREREQKRRAERKKREEAERLMLEMEREKAEQVKLEMERAEEERRERKQKRRAEAKKREEAERVKLEIERARYKRELAEKAEQERLLAEKAEHKRLEAERIEAERIAAKKAEQGRLEAERIEAERIAAKKAEQERLEAELIAAKKVVPDRESESEKIENGKRIHSNTGIVMPKTRTKAEKQEQSEYDLKKAIQKSKEERASQHRTKLSKPSTRRKNTSSVKEPEYNLEKAIEMSRAEHQDGGVSGKNDSAAKKRLSRRRKKKRQGKRR